jgi:microsomal dipeptidase-like Zn-dependent dipeptidase
VDYLASLVGPKFVALGLDFIYYEEVMYERFRRNQDTYPDGYPPPPWKCLSPEKIGALVDELLRRGYSGEDILGILGENFFRVAEVVWK